MMGWKKAVKTMTVSLCAAVIAATAAAAQETALSDGTYNLLLIGSDRRSSDWNGNSDTMILLTVNDHVQKTYMVSFMRDLAAAIPGQGTQKLNSAYAVGGADLLEETLEQNFGVTVDHYAAVDFHEAVEIIDELGGADISQSPDELRVTNGYIRSLCQDWGLDESEYLLSEGQTHLNGLQTLAYMRDRYVGNDYERTERQRNVLSALMKRLAQDDAAQTMKLAGELMSHMDTDITPLEMLPLAAMMPKIKSYELVTDRVPFDDLCSHEGEMLVPSQPDTNERLLGEIYARQ